MLLQDDRTPEQHKSPHLIIMMTDRCLSGWGKASGGRSYAGWACTPDAAPRVENWVRSRSDAMRVRVVLSNYRPPSGPGHCHIYVDESLGGIDGP